MWQLPGELSTQSWWSSFCCWPGAQAVLGDETWARLLRKINLRYTLRAGNRRGCCREARVQPGHSVKQLTSHSGKSHGCCVILEGDLGFEEDTEPHRQRGADRWLPVWSLTDSTAGLVASIHTPAGLKVQTSPERLLKKGSWNKGASEMFPIVKYELLLEITTGQS